jgi:hypothetical protein
MLSLFALPGSVLAQPDLGNWFNPQVGQLSPHGDYRATWYPEQPVGGQPTQLSMVEQHLAANSPLWQDEANEWSASARVRGEFFSTHAILPNTGQPFPAELWNVNLGSAYRHQFDNGWIAGGGLSFGSASDKPFHSINEMTLSASTYLRIPQGERNAWLFSLNYSSNSEVLNGIPLPGVAFFYNPTDWFQATVGLPFASVVIRPVEDLTLNLSYAPLTNLHARASYRILPQLRVFGGFDWNSENYLLADRIDDQQRFFYSEKRLTAGVQYNLTEWASIDVSGGFAFNRYYFEGKNSTTDKQQFNRVDIGDGPFAAIQAKVRF